MNKHFARKPPANKPGRRTTLISGDAIRRHRIGHGPIAQFRLLRVQLNGPGGRLIRCQPGDGAAGRTIPIRALRIAAAVAQLIEVAFDQLLGRQPLDGLVLGGGRCGISDAVAVADGRRRCGRVVAILAGVRGWGSSDAVGLEAIGGRCGRGRRRRRRRW